MRGKIIPHLSGERITQRKEEALWDLTDLLPLFLPIHSFVRSVFTIRLSALWCQGRKNTAIYFASLTVLICQIWVLQFFILTIEMRQNKCTVMNIYARFVKNMRRFCILLGRIGRVKFEPFMLAQWNLVLFSTLLYIIALRVGALYLCKKTALERVNILQK
jgi:hypothetical protein